MNNSQLTSILLKNSTNRFYIEYSGYLFNHISHGIVALARLGASPERAEKFVEWYTPRLEDPGRFQRDARTEAPTGLLGERKNFYTLLDAYKKQLEKHGGSLEQLIGEKFPSLFPGLMGAALHGIIHLGYGYVARNAQLVCEGLAYMHYAHLPIKLSNNTPGKSEEVFGKGPCSILEVLKDMRTNKELVEFMKTKSQSEEYMQENIGEFTRRVRSLFEYRGDDLVQYVNRIQIPIVLEMERMDETLCRALLRWVLDGAITVYALADKHDFFLLHGVTAAWSALQVGPMAVGKSRQLTQELAKTFLTALLATYISQDVPALCTELLQANIEGGNSWVPIIEGILAEDRDEHVYKVIQICYELFQDTDNQDSRNLYYTAACRAFNEEFNF